jgi:hypothetical protein
MKKIIAIISVFLLCTQTTIYSEVIQKIQEERGYISVNSEKMKEVYPNIVQVTFRKEDTAKTLQEASDINKKAIDKINTALSQYLTEGTEVVKGNYTANPIYTYKSNQKLLQGYTVINTITLKTKNTKDLGKMIDTAIKSGADAVNSLSFSFENDNTICKNLISEATQEAKSIAETTAKSTNNTIKGIKAIRTSCSTSTSSSNNLYRNYTRLSTTADTNENAETNVAIGKMNITASVNADFYVK